MKGCLLVVALSLLVAAHANESTSCRVCNLAPTDEQAYITIQDQESELVGYKDCTTIRGLEEGSNVLVKLYNQDGEYVLYGYLAGLYENGFVNTINIILGDTDEWQLDAPRDEDVPGDVFQDQIRFSVMNYYNDDDSYSAYFDDDVVADAISDGEGITMDTEAIQYDSDTVLSYQDSEGEVVASIEVGLNLLDHAEQNIMFALIGIPDSDDYPMEIFQDPDTNTAGSGSGVGSGSGWEFESYDYNSEVVEELDYAGSEFDEGIHEEKEDYYMPSASGSHIYPVNGEEYMGSGSGSAPFAYRDASGAQGYSDYGGSTSREASSDIESFSSESVSSESVSSESLGGSGSAEAVGAETTLIQTNQPGLGAKGPLVNRRRSATLLANLKKLRSRMQK